MRIERRLPEGLIRFTHALVEKKPLRSWFVELENLTASRRRVAFRQMAAQMSSDKVDPELIAAVSALARPDLYAAVLKSLRELCSQ